MENIDFRELRKFGSTDQGMLAFEAFATALEHSTQRDALNKIPLMTVDSRILCVCRERGPVVTFRRLGGAWAETYFIWFTEHRSSDDLIVQVWTGNLVDPLDGARRADVPGESYTEIGEMPLKLCGRKHFRWFDFKGATEFALRLVTRIIREERRAIVQAEADAKKKEEDRLSGHSSDIVH